jgi:hypothetical protein
MIRVYDIELPNEPLSNFQLEESVKKLNIPKFRGCFVRDGLPKEPRKSECGILNLDDSSGGGTHWVCWYKGAKTVYFDGYGLPPPEELIDYLHEVLYNSESPQPAGTVVCGHLCLYVLKGLAMGKDLQDIIYELIL